MFLLHFPTDLNSVVTKVFFFSDGFEWFVDGEKIGLGTVKPPTNGFLNTTKVGKMAPFDEEVILTFRSIYLFILSILLCFALKHCSFTFPSEWESGGFNVFRTVITPEIDRSLGKTSVRK